MSSRAIPGDPEYPREVTVDDVSELSLRIDEALIELNGVDANATALAGLVSALGLQSEVAQLRETRELTRVAEELLDRATVIFKSAMTIMGVEIPSVDGQADTSTTSQEQKVAEPPPSELPGGLDQLSLPPQLAGATPETATKLLAQKLYGITLDELEQYRDRLYNGPRAIVHITNNQSTLVTKDNQDRVLKQIDSLNALETRAINMYVRLHVAGVEEFRRADVTTLFGPPTGFQSMSHVTGAANAVMKELGVPPVFEYNGEKTSNARYMPTGKVLILGQ